MNNIFSKFRVAILVENMSIALIYTCKILQNSNIRLGTTHNRLKQNKDNLKPTQIFQKELKVKMLVCNICFND